MDFRIQQTDEPILFGEPTFRLTCETHDKQGTSQFVDDYEIDELTPEEAVKEAESSFPSGSFHLILPISVPRSARSEVRRKIVDLGYEPDFWS